MGEATTTDRVKGALRIPAGVTIHDARIVEIIEEVEGDILSRLSLTTFGPATYTEKIDTDPGDMRSAMISRFPVLSIVALTVSGSPLVEGDDFYFTRGGSLKLIGSGGFFPDARQAVDVTYTAGLCATLGTTPGDIKRWATLECALQYNQEPMAGLGEQSVRPIKKMIARADEDRMRQLIDSIASKYVDVLH